MLAKLADFLGPRLKPAIAASRQRELENAIKRNERVIRDAIEDIAQQTTYRANAESENVILRRRLLEHLARHPELTPMPQPTIDQEAAQ